MDAPIVSALVEGMSEGGRDMAYEPPVLEEVGSVRELTLALNGLGGSDQFIWFTSKPGGGGGGGIS